MTKILQKCQKSHLKLLLIGIQMTERSKNRLKSHLKVIDEEVSDDSYAGNKRSGD